MLHVMLTRLGGHPSRARHTHIASLSNVLVGWTKAKQTARPYSHCACRAEKIISIVPRPGLKPRCVSVIILSDGGFSRFRRTVIRIFLVSERIEITWEFPHSIMKCIRLNGCILQFLPNFPIIYVVPDL